MMEFLFVLMGVFLVLGIVEKLRLQRPLGAVALAIAIPWLAIVLWRYRMGPYVSLRTALIDSSPVALLFLGLAWVLRKKPEIKKPEPAPRHVPSRAAEDGGL